ncbi:G-patch domain-containing protein/Surp domain-containing protein, partial [Cephalotus follicularis]
LSKKKSLKIKEKKITCIDFDQSTIDVNDRISCSLSTLGSSPMDKGVPSSLFVNDGSFMERFKQLQQAKEKETVKEKENGAPVEESKPRVVISGTSTPKPSIGKTSDTRKTTVLGSSGGKLAFSLKQKSKLVAPAIKLGADEDEDEDETDTGNASGDVAAEKQKLGLPEAPERSTRQLDVVAPPFPSDSTVKNVAEKLASFVAKHGRQFENTTRQKNPGDTPFKFLFDETCADYKYYEYRLSEEEKALSESSNCQTSHSGSTITSASKSTSVAQRSLQHKSNYQIPASALYEATEEPRASISSAQTSSAGRTGESTARTGADPIAMMEFYVKKAAQEERRRQPKRSKDEMPPPASLQGPNKKGHHMGDYIPQDELDKFLATCNDVAAQKAAKEAAERAKIQADNVGHRLLSKMGWKEGEGLGSSRSGIADPIKAGDVKLNNLGVGAHNPGDVTPEDDIYEQYKKRMMLGYRYRPNPLNNPRKSYY